MKPVVRRLAYATLALAFTRVVLGGAPAGDGMVGGLAILVAPRGGAFAAPLVVLLDLLLLAVLAVATVAAGGLGASAPATALARGERRLVRGAALASAALALLAASSGAVAHSLRGLTATALLLPASLALVWAARRADASLRAASRIACGTILLQLALSAALGALGLPATLHAMNAGLGALVWVSLVVATALAARLPAAAEAAPEVPRAEARGVVVRATADQPLLAPAPQPVASEPLASEPLASEPLELQPGESEPVASDALEADALDSSRVETIGARAEPVETIAAAPVLVESYAPAALHEPEPELEGSPASQLEEAAQERAREPVALPVDVVETPSAPAPPDVETLEPAAVEPVAAEAVADEPEPVEAKPVEAPAIEAMALLEPRVEPNAVEPAALEQASLRIETAELDLLASADGKAEEREEPDRGLLVAEVNEVAEPIDVATEAAPDAEESETVAVPDDATSPVSVVAPRRPPTLAVLLARGADF